MLSHCIFGTHLPWFREIRSLIFAWVLEKYLGFDPDKLLTFYWEYDFAIVIGAIFTIYKDLYPLFQQSYEENIISKKQLDLVNNNLSKCLLYGIARNATVWVLVYHTDLKR
jgi:hypothetical protein